ncbi:hypothetical protein B2G71_16815 [Novosphingobium sp. PC22D]|uniref:PilZ domain-containing protein n=1 Tax=Novosphingobium sp. PC22D TaxID=1962403 RepID=UPI000BF04454|nr:PilZ domain-containing protein [Novosphingobium sp. PC22D]PEQ11492.1 hypothetical protein B2G71_16815 [Novosphingobium sp. PC22D]
MAKEPDRTEPRIKAGITAHLRHSGGEGDARVLDVSSRGMLAMMSDPPPRGEYVELTVGRHSLVGYIQWSDRKRFGVRFRERISVSALISGGAGPLELSKSRAATMRRGGLLTALAMDAQSLGRFAQFAFLVLVVGAVGYLVASFAGEGLASLEEAKSALAASSD